MCCRRQQLKLAEESGNYYKINDLVCRAVWRMCPIVTPTTPRARWAAHARCPLCRCTHSRSSAGCPTRSRPASSRSAREPNRFGLSYCVLVPRASWHPPNSNLALTQTAAPCRWLKLSTRTSVYVDSTSAARSIACCTSLSRAVRGKMVATKFWETTKARRNDCVTQGGLISCIMYRMLTGR